MTAVLLVTVAMLLLGVRLRPRAPARTPAGDDPPALPRPPARHATPARRLPGRRRQRVDPAQLAVWCDALARALRGGDTLHRALRETEPPACAAVVLTPAALALERGASVRAAIDGVASHSPHLDLVLVVLRACADNGGTSAEPIDRAAAALRQRAALAAERATQSAQARMSAVVMTLLPGAMLAVLLITSGAVRTTVLSPLGLIVLAAGAGLNLTGWAWMRRIIGGLA